MERVLLLKFGQYSGLRENLLATGNAQLIQVRVLAGLESKPLMAGSVAQTNIGLKKRTGPASTNSELHL